MWPLPLDCTVKDPLILITLCILFICLLKIRKLKNIIASEARRKLTPQLMLELILQSDTGKAGFLLKNESFFLARNIAIEDVALTLDDYGFKVNYTLRFEPVDFIKPREHISLELKVLDKNNEFLPDVTEGIIPHLVSPFFKVRIHYTNIENLKLCVTFSKKRERFLVEEVKTLQ